MTTQNDELKNLLSRRVCFVDLDVAYSSLPSNACEDQLQWGMRAIVKRIEGVPKMTSVIPSNLRRRVLDTFGGSDDVFTKRHLSRSLSSMGGSSTDLVDEEIILEDDMEDGEGTIEMISDFDRRDMIDFVSRQSSVLLQTDSENKINARRYKNLYQHQYDEDRVMMIRVGLMDFTSVLMRAFYQVAEETTERAEVLEYIHETLRDEDHTIPSSRRIFDANSFAGLSAREGNEFERRFYIELCSSSMFTQFVCDRVVFGVRALFDHYVARKVVRVGVQYRARLEGHVQSWLGLLYKIPDFDDEDYENNEDGEIILERWERGLRRYSVSDSKDSLRRTSFMNSSKNRKKRMRRWKTNSKNHRRRRKFKIVSGNLHDLESSLKKFEKNSREEEEKEEELRIDDDANVMAVTVDDVDERKLLVFTRRPRRSKKKKKARVSSDEAAFAMTTPDSPNSTIDSGTPRVEDEDDDEGVLDLSRATREFVVPDMFAVGSNSVGSKKSSSFTSENSSDVVDREESDDMNALVEGAFDFYGDAAFRNVIDANRDPLRPDIDDESEAGEWICFVYRASSSESCKELRTRVRRYISSDPSVRTTSPFNEALDRDTHKTNHQNTGTNQFVYQCSGTRVR